MSDSDAPRRMGEIEDDLQSALEHYSEVDKEYAEASRRRTDALNRVNKLQREFDERVQGLRWSAPQNSDWRRPSPETVDA